MHSMLEVCSGEAREGPGDSGRPMSLDSSSRLSTAVVKEAPHISQEDKEGWFWKVHLGHKRIDPEGVVEVVLPPLLSLGGGPGAGLFDMAAMAALTTCTVGGLMPQARHGGTGVREAKAGSKLEGTGFEKEHIGHTQVALGAGAGAGLL